MSRSEPEHYADAQYDSRSFPGPIPDMGHTYNPPSPPTPFLPPPVSVRSGPAYAQHATPQYHNVMDHQWQEQPNIFIPSRQNDPYINIGQPFVFDPSVPEHIRTQIEDRIQIAFRMQREVFVANDPFKPHANLGTVDVTDFDDIPLPDEDPYLLFGGALLWYKPATSSHPQTPVRQMSPPPRFDNTALKEYQKPTGAPGPNWYMPPTSRSRPVPPAPHADVTTPSEYRKPRQPVQPRLPSPILPPPDLIGSTGSPSGYTPATRSRSRAPAHPMPPSPRLDDVNLKKYRKPRQATQPRSSPIFPPPDSTGSLVN